MRVCAAAHWSRQVALSPKGDIDCALAMVKCGVVRITIDPALGTRLLEARQVNRIELN